MENISQIGKLFEGNGLLLILLALFLFKDQIFSLFNKPAPAQSPSPSPSPTPSPSPDVVVDRPVIDAFTKILPLLLPYVVKLLEKGASAQDEKKDPA